MRIWLCTYCAKYICHKKDLLLFSDKRIAWTTDKKTDPRRDRHSTAIVDGEDVLVVTTVDHEETHRETAPMDHVADLKVVQGADLEVAAWEDPGVALVDVEVAEEWGLVAGVVAHGVAQVAKIGKFLVGSKGVLVDVEIQRCSK